jgi:hypothetical protein
MLGWVQSLTLSTVKCLDALLGDVARNTLTSFGSKTSCRLYRIVYCTSGNSPRMASSRFNSLIAAATASDEFAFPSGEEGPA